MAVNVSGDRKKEDVGECKEEGRAAVSRLNTGVGRGVRDAVTVPGRWGLLAGCDQSGTN